MRLIELSGPPDAAETNVAWGRRFGRWVSGARLAWLALKSSKSQYAGAAALELHAEACAPEGAHWGTVDANDWPREKHQASISER